MEPGLAEIGSNFQFFAGFNLEFTPLVGVFVVSKNLDGKGCIFSGWGPCPFANFHEIHGYAFVPVETGAFAPKKGFVANANHNVGDHGGDTGGGFGFGGLSGSGFGFLGRWGCGFASKEGIDFADGFLRIG